MLPQTFLNLLLALLLVPNVMAKVEVAPPPKASPATEATEQVQQPAHKPPPQPRGEMLYRNHCLGCHESVVHIREKRQAKNLGVLRDTVNRWSQELNLNWSSDEIEDVMLYLNMRYYHYTE